MMSTSPERRGGRHRKPRRRSDEGTRLAVSRELLSVVRNTLIAFLAADLADSLGPGNPAQWPVFGVISSGYVVATCRKSLLRRRVVPSAVCRADPPGAEPKQDGETQECPPLSAS
jgi:hypothetical protein